MPSILVTGANGFIGQHLAKELERQNYVIIKTVRGVGGLKKKSPHQYSLDLTRYKDVESILAYIKPDYVIHLADPKKRGVSLANFRKQYDESIAISLNIIEGCLKLPSLKGFLFLGSCDEYGNSQSLLTESCIESPISSYGLSKLAITKILLSLSATNKFPALVLRPSLVYGPLQKDEMFVSALIQSLLAKKTFDMTIGNQYRDFLYIDDLVEAIIKSISICGHYNCPIINIGSGMSYSIKDFAILTANLIGGSSYSLLNFGAKEKRLDEQSGYIVNNSRAIELLEWNPKTTLSQGLINTVDYFKANFRKD